MSKRRRRQRRRWPIMVLAVIILGASGYALSLSSLFGLDTIEVKGSQNERVIIEASGLRLGQRAMGLDLPSIERNIEQLPTIASARVQRTGALGITIIVVERRPSLEIRSGTERWFVAQDGVVIDRAPDGPVPLLLLPENETPDGEAAAAVLDVWRAFPRALRARLRSFGVTPGGAITAGVDDVEIVFGHADRIKDKVRAAGLLLDEAKRSGQKLVSIDVRAPEHPAARFA